MDEQPKFLTVRELIAELSHWPLNMYVTVPVLWNGDPDSVLAQGDVQGVDSNGDCVVLFVMDGVIAPFEEARNAE